MIQHNKNILDKIILKYLNKEEFEKFQDYIASSNNTLPKCSNKKNSTNRTVNISSDYVEYLISFINISYKEVKQLNLLTDIGEGIIESGLIDLALLLFYEIVKQTKGKISYKRQYAVALYNIGRIYSLKGKWRKSNSFINQSQKVFLKQNDTYGLVRCFNLMGCNNFENGYFNKGLLYFRKCLTLLDKETDLLLLAKIELNIGNTYHIKYDFEKALSFFRRAIIKYEKFNDIYNLAMLRFNTGTLFYEIEKYNQAIEELDISLSIAIDNDMFAVAGRIYYIKSMIFLKTGDINLSIGYWKMANDIYRKINDQMLKFFLLLSKGLIERRQNKYKMSERYLLRGREHVMKLNYPIQIAKIEYELGVLYTKWKKKEEAIGSFKTANKLYKKSGALPLVKKTEKEILKLTD